MYRLLIIFLVLLLACSEGTKSNADIDVISQNLNLVIKNNTEQNIYFNVIEETCIPLIDWIPSLAHPMIEAGASAQYSFADIIDCIDGRSVQTGDPVTIYWWAANFEKNGIKNMRIIL